MVSCSFGYVSLVQSQRLLNIYKVIEKMGIEFVILHAEIDFTKLYKKYVETSVIKKEEIYHFRTLTSSRNEFFIKDIKN